MDCYWTETIRVNRNNRKTMKKVAVRATALRNERKFRIQGLGSC